MQITRREFSTCTLSLSLTFCPDLYSISFHRARGLVLLMVVGGKRKSQNSRIPLTFIRVYEPLLVSRKSKLQVQRPCVPFEAPIPSMLCFLR